MSSVDIQRDLHVRARNPVREFWSSEQMRPIRMLLRKRMGLISMLFLGLLIVCAAFSGPIAPYDPLESHPVDRLQGPSTTYWLGTDQLGRDVLSRLIFGARLSLYVGLMTVTITALVGTTLGMVSGYFSGIFDLIIQRLVDAFQALPGLILAMSLIAIMGSGTSQVILAIAIIATPSYVRVIRSAVLPVKENEYILAARTLGATNVRIIFRHVLPNVLAPVLILVSTIFGLAILIEGALSFLGLGTPPPTPSWGNMIGGDARVYLESAPTLSIFPGLAITLSVLAFNLLGDAIRDVFDPRLRGLS